MARPIQYTPDAVTARATELFWRTGYGSSSVDQLVKATGLNKHSLYKLYRSKEGLFVHCLEHYIHHEAQPFLDLLNQHQGLPAIRHYLQRIDQQRGQTTRLGCLIANTAAELGDGHGPIQQRIDAYYRHLAEQLRRCVAEGQQRDEIRGDIDPFEIAKTLTHLVQGIAISQRIGSSINADSDALLQLIASPATTPCTPPPTPPKERHDR